jgi:predicted transcriptional regulator
MLISEIMTDGGCVCTEDTSLVEVYALIKNSVDGRVIVIDSLQHRVPIGIVNEHTICESIVGRQRSVRSLDAGAVMSANIKRVCVNADVAECEHLLNDNVDAILAVDERRQFQGTIDTDRLAGSIKTGTRHYHTPSIFTGVLQPQMPAAVEIPAFGWLK